MNQSGFAILGMILLAQGAFAEVVGIDGLGPDDIAGLRVSHDFWGLDRGRNRAVFRLSGDQRERLEQLGYSIETDLERQAELDRWRSLDHRAQLLGDAESVPGFACYRSVAKTHADLDALAAAFPTRSQWRRIGDSWQAGGSIFALVLANQASPQPKAPVVIMAAQHARELATAEIATRLAELLLQNPDRDPDIDWLLDHREIHIIAQQNPDGRRQVEQGQSLWRKNHNESACTSGDLSSSWPGIDLNRNSSFLWGDDAASSGSSCSQIYRGPVTASEPETQAVQNYLAGIFAVQRPGAGLDDPAPIDAEGLFISLHSFGELVLLPWEGRATGNENNAPNHDALTILGRRFGFLTGYEVSRWQSLGPASGTMVDYAYGEFGVAAYTFEVGTRFTESCASFESTVWPASRRALLLAIKAGRRPYQRPAGPEITALQAVFENGVPRLAGSADDTRYFRGNVSEPPAADPVSNIVEFRVSLGLPEHLADQSFVFPVAEPAEAVSFDVSLPPGAALPANGRLFVTAVDAQGQVGLARVVTVGNAIFNDGFE
ncbi:MAG: M14 family zinc carboxypeptidase [Wenzhouxiangellaceae bacterium]|nr:M14 family zinc carboxypeptidase [Wenzhouxiangellaceae bacterium]